MDTLTIVIANQAGSAGKTTLTTTLAGMLADQGVRVRAIDSDGQANATFSLGVDAEGCPSLSDVLLQRATIADAEQPTKLDCLTVVPASAELDRTAIALTTQVMGGEQRLRRALDTADPVQVNLIDCPGALNILTVGALVAATHAVTVTQPTIKELAGVPAFEETVRDVRDAYNPRVQLAAVVPSAVPAQGRVYEMALSLLREEYKDLVTPPVRRSKWVPEAYSHQVPLHMHAPREAVTHDFRAVLSYLTDRIGLPTGSTSRPPAYLM